MPERKPDGLYQWRSFTKVSEMFDLIHWQLDEKGLAIQDAEQLANAIEDAFDLDMDMTFGDQK